MKKIVLIILSLFVLVGCSISSLSLSRTNELVLNHNDISMSIANKVLDVKSLNFKDLFVTIKKVQNSSGKTLFYEQANTELNFEFNFGGLYTVMYIFDNTQKYDEVYRENNLRFVQLNLKNGTYLNLIIQASDMQSYSFIYGFSNEDFLNIVKSLKTKDKKLVQLKYQGVIFDSSSKALSNWNDTLVFFAPLITPLRDISIR